MPTSPGCSPTSPSYDPMDPPTIDPMTPDREKGERKSAYRAQRVLNLNDPEYAVTFRWRFWLKGTMGSHEALDHEEAMKMHFASYMENNADFRAGNNNVAWDHRMQVLIFERPQHDWVSEIRHVHTILVTLTLATPLACTWAASRTAPSMLLIFDTGTPRGNGVKGKWACVSGR